MTIRMGYWDCPACGNRRIEGPRESCPACGRPRDKAVAFYTDDQAAIVEDPELVRRARMGADWHCRFCGADNRAGHVECHGCGAGPDGTRSREVKVLPVATPPPRKSSGLLVLGIVLAVLAALAGGVWFLFVRTTALEVTVQEATWVKSVEVEERKLERESAWLDEVPAGVRELKREERKRSKEVQDGTEKIKVGTKDLGNGMFEDVFEERPKMVTKAFDDTWVTYEAERWVKGKTLEEKSTDGKEPPDPKLRKSKDKREANRESKLVLALEGSDGEDYRFEIDLEDAPKAAQAYKQGDRFTAEVSATGAVRSLR